MNEDEVQALIYAGVSEAIADSLPVQYPMRNFKPPNSGKYFEIVHIANNRLNEFWGKQRTFRGFVRVILHHPLDDSGSIPATTILAGLADKVPKGTRWGKLIISDHPQIAPPIIEPARALLVMTLYYNSSVI